MNLPTHKKCNQCGLVKLAYEFHKHAVNRDGLQTQCKACKKIRRAQWILDNPEKHQAVLRENNRRRALHPEKYRKATWRYSLLTRYGLTESDMQHITKAQGGRCKLCKRCFSTTAPLVDHDHDSGAVRGLLCARCNTLIGYLEKNTALLPEAFAYIAESAQQIIGGAP